MPGVLQNELTPERTERADADQLGEKGIENLKFLMDYTKFHIGLYTALFVAAVGAIEKGVIPDQAKTAVRVAAVFLVLSGMAAGIVGSSIPDAVSYADLRTKSLRPRWWRGRALFLKDWIALEHFLFWCALLIVTLWLIIPPIWVAITELLQRFR